MRKLETPNMMKVIPVPSATIARVESGAEGRGGPEKDCVWCCERGGGMLLGAGSRQISRGKEAGRGHRRRGEIELRVGEPARRR